MPRMIIKERLPFRGDKVRQSFLYVQGAEAVMSKTQRPEPPLQFC